MPVNKKTSGRPRRSPGRPTSEETSEIDTHLIQIALREFVEHGYGGASVTRMVKESGISKTTVYSRFASKQELFHAIVQQQIQRISPESLLELDGEKLDLEDGLKSYANNVLELNLEGDFLGVNRLMFSESHRFPELGLEVAERNRRGIERIANFICDCAETDNVPCDNPRGIAEIFILMLRGWFLDVMLTNRKVSGREREQWVDLAVHTLLASREHW